MLNTLDRLRERSLDLSKETHPEKPYYAHVEECREFVEKLMRKIYNYPQELVTFAVLLSELHDVGKLLPKWSINQEKRPRHAIEGAEWFLGENIDLHINSQYREILAYAIMTHHSPLYIPDKIGETINEAEKIKLRHFSRYSKCRVLSHNINSLLRRIKKQMRFDFADVMGIVKVADVISAKNLSIDNILAQYRWPENLEDKLRDGILKRAYEKKGSFDRSKFERQIAIASSEEKHLLVAAPTGWGKTALALIRTVFKKPVKVFYILPTITAIKDFYDTFTRLLDEAYIGEYFYFVDVELLGKRDLEEENPLDIYRYFIPKITLTTMDQLLLTVLQIGKYHARRFNLKGSLLVLDEFHLLTPQLIAGLRLFLKSLSEHYNISCLFMSATPSPVYRDLLREALPHLEIMILDDEYRRLRRHKIDIVDMGVEEFIAKREDLLRRNRALVLVNTVSKAQKLYNNLKEDLSGSRNVVLIHGDFAYKDRAKKEDQISSADILVSTQVAEVSLDVSFDLLITELSPIPSLVQRFGRVNRYGGTPVETNIYICKSESNKPYNPVSINLAYEFLPTLVEGLERKGEETYLNENFWQYEQIYRKDVERMEEKISEKMDIMLNFFSFLADEKEILQTLGREETWLAIPKIYLREVLALSERLKGAKKYEERKNIYAQIKKYLVPASRSDIKRAEWSDELKLPVIINYDEDIGIIRD